MRLPTEAERAGLQIAHNAMQAFVDGLAAQPLIGGQPQALAAGLAAVEWLRELFDSETTEQITLTAQLDSHGCRSCPVRGEIGDSVAICLPQSRGLCGPMVRVRCDGTPAPSVCPLRLGPLIVLGETE